VQPRPPASQLLPFGNADGDAQAGRKLERRLLSGHPARARGGGVSDADRDRPNRGVDGHLRSYFVGQDADKAQAERAELRQELAAARVNRDRMAAQLDRLSGQLDELLDHPGGRLTRLAAAPNGGTLDPMTEQTFDRACLDCPATVTFPGPGDATCPKCGLRMFLTAGGQVGRYPSQDWEPGGIQGRH
jgi:hypothetical protein